MSLPCLAPPLTHALDMGVSPCASADVQVWVMLMCLFRVLCACSFVAGALGIQSRRDLLDPREVSKVFALAWERYETAAMSV